MSTTHFFIQGKGGIGKSTCAALLAQILKYEFKLNTKCLNIDHVNDSFYDFKSLEVESIPIIQDNKVVPREFDRIIEMIISSDSHFVIDSGASSFTPLMEYLTFNNVVDLLNEHGKTVYFHSPVTGGAAQKDTLSALLQMLMNLQENCNFVIWENRFFGDINFDGITLKDLPMFKEFKHKIEGTISFGEQNYSTADFSKMLQNKHTFEEATSPKSKDYFLMEKQRLLQIKRQLFPQISNALKHTEIGV